MRIALPCILAAVSLAPLSVADDKSEAQAVIRATVDKALATFRQKELDRPARLERIMQVVDPVFDLSLMAKLTLGPTYWPQFSAEQQREFTKLFIEQLQTTYFGKIELFAEETVQFGAPTQTDGKVVVDTSVTSKGERVTIRYRLRKGGGAWRVYDVEIQGVSLVSSYRSQYQQVLRNATPEALLKRMREKVQSLKKD